MRSPFLTALFHPVNIIMLGLAAFAGLVAAWWLFPAGLLFWGAMVFNVARDQALRLNYQMQQRAPLAPRFQRHFDRMQRAEVAVFNALASASSKTRRVFQPVCTEISTLTNEVHTLCQRMTVLENYRAVSQSQSNLSTDLKHIDEAITSTEDTTVRREYEESRLALHERLAKLQTVSSQLERVEAQLLSLANEMDGIVTEVVRLQATGADSAAAFVPELVMHLRQQTAQLRVFEKEATRLQ